jgi:hypothetical protein
MVMQIECYAAEAGADLGSKCEVLGEEAAG